MPRKLTPVHILTASVDLESRKTIEEKRAEEAEARADPDRTTTIQESGCQVKSAELLEEIAQYLQKEGMTSYQVYCGYRIGERKWQVYVMFGKAGMTNSTRNEIQSTLVEKYLRAQPDTDQAVNEAEDVPYGLIRDWEFGGWKHMTKFTMYRERRFVLEVDGKKDLDEVLAYVAATTKDLAEMRE
ncbi:hypothetical protein BDV10DRAFT_186178 [Aspergillus recurvatus]